MMTTTTTTLSGSGKQVAWATALLAGAVAELESRICALRAAGDDTNAGILADVLRTVSAATSARVVIDARAVDQSLVDSCEETCLTRYSVFAIIRHSGDRTWNSTRTNAAIAAWNLSSQRA